jgi:hypothetical protein
MTTTAATDDAGRWLTQFANATRRAMRDRWHARSCIAATRIGLEVLRAFGVVGYPTPVTVAAFNRAGWLAFQREPDQPVTESDIPNAWAVGIVGTGAVDQQTGSWDGHLVLHVNRYLVDLSADQLSRPQRNLPVDHQP